MMIKTETGTHNVGGSGQTNLNTVLGSIGAIGTLSNNGCGNNGILGNIFGNNNHDCYETKESAMLRQQVSYLAADNETNTKILELYRFNESQLKERDRAITDLAVADAVALEREACARREIERLQAITAAQSAELCEIRVKLAQNDGALTLEAERRACGDQNIYNWAKATFVEGELIMPADKICPPVRTA